MISKNYLENLQYLFCFFQKVIVVIATKIYYFQIYFLNSQDFLINH